MFIMFDMFCPQTHYETIKTMATSPIVYGLFVVCCFTSSSRITCLYGDVIIELPVKDAKFRPMFDTCDLSLSCHICGDTGPG